MTLNELMNEFSVNIKRYTSLSNQFQREASRGEVERAGQKVGEAGGRTGQLGEVMPHVFNALNEGRIDSDSVATILQASLAAVNELISANELMLVSLRLADLAEDNATKAVSWLKRAEDAALKAIGPF